MDRGEDDQDHPETSGTTHQAAVLGAKGTLLADAKATTTTKKIQGRAPKRRFLALEGDDEDLDDAGSSIQGAHPDVGVPSTKRYLTKDSRRSSKDSLPASVDFGLKLSQFRNDFDELSKSDTGESVNPAMLPSRQTTVPEEDLEQALDDENDLALTGTTLVASDSTAKTPKIKDDKAWKVLREKIMAEARKMGFEPELSTDNQTIQVLNADKKEQMRVERQADKTLKLSSEPPTTIKPEHLIRLFLVTGSKTCNLKNAESAEVAAELYQKLTKQNIEVTLSSKVLEQLQSDSRYEKIAEEYLLKNPSQATNASPARPTSRSRVIPPTQPTGSKVQPDKADTTEPSTNAAADPVPDTAHDTDEATSAADPVPDPDEAARSTHPRP